ncbi:MAG: ABC transporter permease, partial [Pseudomonadota bacterium]
MLRFLLHRLFGAVAAIFVAAISVFWFLEILPGDAAQILLGTEIRDDTLAALRNSMGLDRPAGERFVSWISGLLTGELGESRIYAVPILDILSERLALSLPLALYAFVLMVILALPLGLVAAARPGSFFDSMIIGFAQLGLAIPNFWFAILILMVFGLWLGVLPTPYFLGWENGFLATLYGLTMPALTLALTEAAILSRIVRASMIESLGEDFIRTVRAK